MNGPEAGERVGKSFSHASARVRSRYTTMNIPQRGPVSSLFTLIKVFGCVLHRTDHLVACACLPDDLGIHERCYRESILTSHTPYLLLNFFPRPTHVMMSWRTFVYLQRKQWHAVTLFLLCVLMCC